MVLSTNPFSKNYTFSPFFTLCPAYPCSEHCTEAPCTLCYAKTVPDKDILNKNGLFWDFLILTQVRPSHMGLIPMSSIICLHECQRLLNYVIFEPTGPSASHMQTNPKNEGVLWRPLAKSRCGSPDLTFPFLF